MTKKEFYEKIILSSKEIKNGEIDIDDSAFQIWDYCRNYYDKCQHKVDDSLCPFGDFTNITTKSCWSSLSEYHHIGYKLDIWKSMKS
jgi:hypothetical protein